MKDGQQKKTNQIRNCGYNGEPNNHSKKSGDSCKCSFNPAISESVKQDAEKDKWEEKVQPTENGVCSHKYLISSVPWPTLHQIRTETHDASPLPLELGAVFVGIGLIICLFKLIRGERCYLFEPGPPMCDPAAMFFFPGLVLLGLGVIMRSI